MPKAPKEAQEGFPKDGDELDDATLVSGQDDPGDADPPAPPKDPLQEIKDQMAAQERRHQEELAALRRTIGPGEPKPPAPSKDQDPDWDQLLFSKPKEAVDKIIEKAGKIITANLEGKYRADQGKEKFWNAFYDKHKDLKREKDHDLVELTLNKHLPDLANVPVDQALDKLADLTRDRILGYAGGARPRSGSRARVEGAGSPAPRAPAADKPTSSSISDVIRNRRANRTRSVAA